MHIWLRIIALLFSAHARSSSSTRVSPLLTEKFIYLHDFLTFTDEKYTCDMSVMHWGKHNVSNALNSTDIFAVCHDGSIWFMIDIKGCLRISVHKLVRLCECTLSLITVLALIYLINQNSSQVLDFNPRFSSGLHSVVVISHIHVQQWGENVLEKQFREEKSIYI